MQQLLLMQMTGLEVSTAAKKGVSLRVITMTMTRQQQQQRSHCQAQ
jgi:hypothetical protein